MTATKTAKINELKVVARLKEIIIEKPEQMEFVLIDREALKKVPVEKYTVIRS